MLLAAVVVIMILKVVSVVILLKVFIAFCNIRGGGGGSGGAILYEKKDSDCKRKKYSTSPAAIGAFRRHFVESIAMFRRRIGHKHGHHREYYKNCHFLAKNSFIAGHLNGAFTNWSAP